MYFNSNYSWGLVIFYTLLFSLSNTCGPTPNTCGQLPNTCGPLANTCGPLANPLGQIKQMTQPNLLMIGTLWPYSNYSLYSTFSLSNTCGLGWSDFRFFEIFENGYIVINWLHFYKFNSKKSANFAACMHSTRAGKVLILKKSQGP